MNDREQLISRVFQAADNKLVGRIRVQKVFYLLEQLGLGEDHDFSYHHYGPYSEDLTREIDSAVSHKVLHEEPKPSKTGNVYSIFTALTPEGASSPDEVGSLAFDVAKGHIDRMKSVSSVVLELAATIHWLQKKENVSNWETELKNRKPAKATDARIQKAQEVLRDLKLA